VHAAPAPSQHVPWALQVAPAQQTPPPAHDAPGCLQGWQMPALQMSEQQSLARVQAALSGLQAPHLPW
jgi:hypothetical protein